LVGKVPRDLEKCSLKKGNILSESQERGKEPLKALKFKKGNFIFYKEFSYFLVKKIWKLSDLTRYLQDRSYGSEGIYDKEESKEEVQEPKKVTR